MSDVGLFAYFLLSCQRGSRDWFLRFAHLAFFAYDAPKKFAVDTIRACGERWMEDRIVRSV
eukprot:2365200-Amphidinium_carterae.1